MTNNEKNLQQLKSKYDDEHSLRQAFESLIKQIITDILKEYPILSIETRTKTADSFIAKANRRGKKYKNPLTEITDITGIRIVVEYKDEAEMVESVLRSKLVVDDKNSRDTREEAPETEFGYSAIHIVASIPQQTAEFYRSTAFKDRKFEIQIRTSLENAWATKSRSLFYERTVPKEFKRQLNRLSALLELADNEFLELKNKISKTHRNTQTPATKRGQISGSDIAAFLNSSGLISSLMHRLKTRKCQVTLSERPEFTQEVANVLMRQGVLLPDDIEQHLEKLADDIVLAAEMYMRSTNMESYALDSLLVAALAIINNGDITPEEYTKAWNERWRNGFIETAKQIKRILIR